MAIDRAKFAEECVRQGTFFRIEPHYLLGVAELRSGRLARQGRAPDEWVEFPRDRRAGAAGQQEQAEGRPPADRLG